ncbi:hypothetical protein PSECIP111854_00935 [Pseudoalteromonas sp. CIP111854]|uniref:Uncharacterized protein n=1 Tax=Pseudoalteromonas holothuriae TaxID=2963714 RepID=A0A9W4QTB6_9GAMM|nr:hypothetical protein PSECIP111854_00935 [Pseudoalteromonas sp. CIP111854]
MSNKLSTRAAFWSKPNASTVLSFATDIIHYAVLLILLANLWLVKTLSLEYEMWIGWQMCRYF